MKVSELTGAELDYWVARAEGIPAEQLSIRWLPGMGCENCIYEGRAMPFSIVWSYGGPLIEEYKIDLYRHDKSNWDADAQDEHLGSGSTPLQAICRAVVRAKFGDEVDGIRESAAHLSAQS